MTGRHALLDFALAIATGLVVTAGLVALLVVASGALVPHDTELDRPHQHEEGTR